MQRFIFSFSLLFISFLAGAQSTYRDSMEAFIKNYVETHEVITGKDRQHLKFYPIDEAYRVTARFESITNGKWFQMETSGNTKQTYREFGRLHFNLQGKELTLTLYQSQRLLGLEEYKDHLFLPFTDLTSGVETYETGRYIDISRTDIHDGKLVIDFNKAYNPYCAYVDEVYNCPIPPRGNYLEVEVFAGEKKYR